MNPNMRAQCKQAVDQHGLQTVQAYYTHMQHERLLEEARLDNLQLDGVPQVPAFESLSAAQQDAWRAEFDSVVNFVPEQEST